MKVMKGGQNIEDAYLTISILLLFSLRIHSA